jgi:hypothetical protein
VFITELDVRSGHVDGDDQQSAARSRAVITSGFKSVKLLVDDYLTMLPAHILHLCFECIGAYGSQGADVNISLTAVNMFLTIADYLRDELKPTGGDSAAKSKWDKIWTSMFGVLTRLSLDFRPDVRNSALRILFSVVTEDGDLFDDDQWQKYMEGVIFPLIDSIQKGADDAETKDGDAVKDGPEIGVGKGGKVQRLEMHHSRNTAAKQWNETRVLVLKGSAQILRRYTTRLAEREWFHRAWGRFLKLILDSILLGSAREEVALASVKALQGVTEAVTYLGPQVEKGRGATAGSRVKDGAMVTTAAASSTADLPGADSGDGGDSRHHRHKMETLWEQAWEAFQGTAVIAVDDDCEVTCAIVKSLEALHKICWDHEFAAPVRMTQLIRLLEELTIVRQDSRKNNPAFLATNKRPIYTPPVDIIITTSFLTTSSL